MSNFVYIISVVSHPLIEVSCYSLSIISDITGLQLPFLGLFTEETEGFPLSQLTSYFTILFTFSSYCGFTHINKCIEFGLMTSRKEQTTVGKTRNIVLGLDRQIFGIPTRPVSPTFHCSVSPYTRLQNRVFSTLKVSKKHNRTWKRVVFLLYQGQITKTSTFTYRVSILTED